jgi:hypothetical protein
MNDLNSVLIEGRVLDAASVWVPGYTKFTLPHTSQHAQNAFKILVVGRIPNAFADKMQSADKVRLVGRIGDACVDGKVQTVIWAEHWELIRVKEVADNGKN